MTTFGIADVVARVSDAAFGRKLVTNVLRGHVVEAMIALALEPEWMWCAADYNSWDFEHVDGRRLEVKQSAWRQTWAPPSHGRVYPSFDIADRTGRWEGAQFIKEHGRAADTYIFAYHGVQDDAADHRDPVQWKFYVVPASSLPTAKRIGLPSVRALTPAIALDELAAAVRQRPVVSTVQPGRVADVTVLPKPTSRRSA